MVPSEQRRWSMPERQPDPGDAEPGDASADAAPPTGPRALLLNATFEPLAVVTAKRAVVLMLTGKAECVQAALEGAFHSESLTIIAPSALRPPGRAECVEAAPEGAFHSESLTIIAPSVMRLSRYVRVPYRRPVP